MKYLVKEIVFDLDEWRKIERLAAEAKLNNTEYIRRVSLNKKIIQMNMPDITHVLNVMKIVANNLNQLAKKAHEINKIYAADFDKMGGEWRPLCLLLRRTAREKPLLTMSGKMSSAERLGNKKSATKLTGL